MREADCLLLRGSHCCLLRRFRENGVVPVGCSAEITRHSFALVEYPDGSVGKVDPALVHFLDGKGVRE